MCAPKSAPAPRPLNSAVSDFSLHPRDALDQVSQPRQHCCFRQLILRRGADLCTTGGRAVATPPVLTPKNVSRHDQTSPGGKPPPVRTMYVRAGTVHTKSSADHTERSRRRKGHHQDSPLRASFGVVREFTRFSISR